MTRAARPSCETPSPAGRKLFARVILGVLIVLGVVVVLIAAVGWTVIHAHGLVEQGFLPATAEYGYGYEVRRLWQENLYGVSSTNTVAVILWKADRKPDFGEMFEVDGRHIRTSETSDKTSTNGKAVYALQPDYTCRRIALSSREVKQAFQMMDEGIKKGCLKPNAFWQDCIEPVLKLVGPQAPATNPADVSPGAG